MTEVKTDESSFISEKNPII